MLRLVVAVALFASVLAAPRYNDYRDELLDIAKSVNDAKTTWTAGLPDRFNYPGLQEEHIRTMCGAMKGGPTPGSNRHYTNQGSPWLVWCTRKMVQLPKRLWHSWPSCMWQLLGELFTSNVWLLLIVAICRHSVQWNPWVIVTASSLERKWTFLQRTWTTAASFVERGKWW